MGSRNDVVDFIEWIYVYDVLHHKVMCERFQRSNLPLCRFGFELLMKLGYVFLDMLTVIFVLSKLSKLLKVYLVRFCCFGAKGFSAQCSMRDMC